MEDESRLKRLEIWPARSAGLEVAAKRRNRGCQSSNLLSEFHAKGYTLKEAELPSRFRTKSCIVLGVL